MTVVLVFNSAETRPRSVVLHTRREDVEHVMAWYGAFHAGDRYTVTMDGRNVPMDQNGCPERLPGPGLGSHALPGHTENAPITPADKRACLERELRMRRRVYPRFVQTGKLTQAEADREIAVMEAILADYPDAQGALL